MELLYSRSHDRMQQFLYSIGMINIEMSKENTEMTSGTEHGNTETIMSHVPVMPSIPCGIIKVIQQEITMNMIGDIAGNNQIVLWYKRSEK
jgi:hypothetical protein